MLVRSQGHVRTVILSPIRQMAYGFLLLLGGFYFIFVTTKALNPTPIVVVTEADNQRQMERMRSQLAEAQSRQNLIEAQLEERTRLLTAAEVRMEATHIAIRDLIERAGINDMAIQEIIDRDKEKDYDSPGDRTLWPWD